MQFAPHVDNKNSVIRRTMDSNVGCAAFEMTMDDRQDVASQSRSSDHTVFDPVSKSIVVGRMSAYFPTQFTTATGTSLTLSTVPSPDPSGVADVMHPIFTGFTTASGRMIFVRTSRRASHLHPPAPASAPPSPR
jgi:hypothetical protein